MLGLNASQSFIPALIRFSTLGATALTFGRCGVAAVILLALAAWRGQSLRGRTTRWLTIACGLLLAAHWSLFIQSVKLTTVAVAQVSLFTFPVITSLLEPLVERRRLRAGQVLAALGALAGIAVMQHGEGWEGATLLGSGLAVLSAVCFAVRSLITRRLVRTADGGLLMGWQAAVACLAMAPFLRAGDLPSWREAGVVLVFGTVFTAWPHTAMVRAMAHLPAAAVGILVTLQVPLSVGIAWVWPGERVHAAALLGLGIVLASVVAESLTHWREPGTVPRGVARRT